MSQPRINLLPYRQEKRARKQREFIGMLFLAAIAGAAVVFLVNQFLDNRLEAQNSRNQLLTAEIKKLDEQIKEIDRLREEIRLAIERKKTVEALQANRAQSVRLLDQMAHQLPEGVYLRSAKQKGNTVTVNGYAQSNAHVSALMRNIENSQWLDKPRLVEVKLVENKDNLQPNQRKDAKNVKPTMANEFTMIFDVKRADQQTETQTAATRQGGA
ncbi:MAG: PilN domain-containing protein [Burkholderiales bacterium]|jgi:type IV pilus assembly protein PilN|nr:PilN domain-containing protein [Burkholderiales bacterium]